jgi:hypothetical protein
VSGVVSAVAKVLKWIVLVVLVLLVAWFVLRHLASVSDWARQLLEALAAFWRSLFGGAAPVAEEAEDEPTAPRRPRPFADFSDPFADGSAARRSPEELVCYSFAALEAWAYERDLPRRTDETPLEFAERLGGAVPALDAHAQRLATLYARLAYARRRLPDASRDHLARLWQRLATAQEQPVAP